MSHQRRGRRLVAMRIGLTGVAFGLVVSGCTELEPPPGGSNHPAELSSPDPQGIREVRLTEHAARRVGLQTSPVTASGPDLVVPNAALIYDEQGKPWVYTVIEPLTYARVSVTVAGEVDDDTMALSGGPAVGTQVVTTGATEVYGTELEIDGAH